VTPLLGLVLSGAAAAATPLAPPGGLDAWAVTELREGPRAASDALVYGSLGLAAGSAATLLLDGHGPRPALALGAALALDLGLTEAGKRAFDRRRPWTYGVDPTTGEPVDWASDPDATKSFPSGHTSVTAASCFATAENLRRAGALDTPARRVLAYGLAAGATASAGALRVAAGKHFPTDVLAGAALGTGLGLLVPGLVHREW
jgi:membrane-associated phospholipid phosphatase